MHVYIYMRIHIPQSRTCAYIYIILNIIYDKYRRRELNLSTINLRMIILVRGIE